MSRSSTQTSNTPPEPGISAPDELLDYGGSGMSIMEQSHRGREYDAVHREAIDIASDRIARSEDDEWNRRVLELLAAGKIAELESLWESFATQAKADMGFKHLAFVLGALGGAYGRAEILGYGPTYGAGAAVIAFEPGAP